MAIAVTELLISGRPVSSENLASFLLAAYKRDPRFGYSPITRSMLEESETGSEFLSILPETEIKERKSDGAAMRALPIGFLPEMNEVIRLSIISARITHGHPDAVSATIGIALIAYFRYHYQEPFSVIIKRLPDLIPSLTEEAKIYLEIVINSPYKPETILSEYEAYGVPYTESLILLGAVIALLAQFGEEPHACLINAVSLGGDTDTTACITLGAALIFQGGEIPCSLISGLENKKYGRQFLIATGDALSTRYRISGNPIIKP